ncbi:MAG: TetR/AcrR family transcriptional regulator [Promethearchaeota archaeon]
MIPVQNEQKPPKFHRNKEAKIKLIIDTFLDLVEKKGYANVSTNQVAKNAGISIGTIYKYFENKADILDQGFQTSISDFGEMPDFIEMITEHNENKIRSFIQRFLGSHRAHYKLNEAIDQATILNQEIFHKFQDNIEKTIRQFATYVSKSDHRFSNISIDELVKALMISINTIDNIIHQHLFRRKIFETDDNLIEYLTQHFIFTLNYYNL